jgi:DNA primase
MCLLTHRPHLTNTPKSHKKEDTMEKTAIKIERQAVISNPEDQQKFSKMTDLRRKIKQILNITKYYQETLKITTTPNAKGYINTLCPFHKDTSPSLSVYTKTGNCICRGACNEKWSIFQFHKKTGKFKTIAKATRNLARLAGVPISNKEVARYSYVDEQREELFHVRKYDNKSIPYRKTPDGKYKSGLKGVQKIPYNLPDVISSRKIYICEGEKDTVNLAKAFGVVSTTFQGANWSDEYQKWFKDKIIRIFPDNDKAGIKFADDVALGLFGIAKSIKIVKLPGLEIKGDVTD